MLFRSKAERVFDTLPPEEPTSAGRAQSASELPAKPAAPTGEDGEPGTGRAGSPRLDEFEREAVRFADRKILGAITLSEREIRW